MTSVRPLLMIPGPVDVSQPVKDAEMSGLQSHLAPAFVAAFAEALKGMRGIWGAASGQPFLVAGSGTLAMELAAANLIEPGDAVLAVSTGLFGERMAAICERHGARVEIVRAPLGQTADPDAVRGALSRATYKVVTITHVDTSTGVLVDPAPIAALAREHGALTVLDGVCSVGGVELRQEGWEIDVTFTASQKALAAPPGLALLVASPRAMDAWRSRRSPVASYYADWANWLPIMDGYELGTPSYFGTPAVTLVSALSRALSEVLEEGMERRVARHRVLGVACRRALEALGIALVPAAPGACAPTLSCAYYPEGVDGKRLLQEVLRAGAVLAGGLHPEIRSRSFRIGHMGVTGGPTLAATIAALEEGLAACGHHFAAGACVSAVDETMRELPPA